MVEIDDKLKRFFANYSGDDIIEIGKTGIAIVHTNEDGLCNIRWSDSLEIDLSDLNLTVPIWFRNRIPKNGWIRVLHHDSSSNVVRLYLLCIRKEQSS